MSASSSSSALEERFAELAAAFEAHLDAVKELSNPYKRLEHPSFEALVALGPDAIPLVEQRYRSGSPFWGAVLIRLTNRTDLGDGVTGDIDKVRHTLLKDG